MWNGKTLRHSEGKEISGIEEVLYMKEFNSYIHRAINGSENIKLYLDLDRETIDSNPITIDNYLDKVNTDANLEVYQYPKAVNCMEV